MSLPVILLAAPIAPSLRDALATRCEVLGPLAGNGPFAMHALAIPVAQCARVQAIISIDSVLIGRDTLALFPSLGLVCVTGSGYEGVDLAAARQRGIAIAHSGNANAASVAELAVGLMIASVRGFREETLRLRNGQWSGASHAQPGVRRGLGGRRLGIYGMGAIGGEIAQRALPFGMQIGYHNRRPIAGSAAVYCASLHALAQWCDVLMISVRADDTTRHAVNASVLQALGRDGHVINIARGSVVDEAALADALARGAIAGAGLDVFENEPFVPPALLALPTLVALPHIGGASQQARVAMQAMVLANIDAFLAGMPLPAPVRG
ncbi:MAG: NAD(P)-dependent oxidoreductase [Casimicrobiaceae bacterium]